MTSSAHTRSGERFRCPLDVGQGVAVANALVGAYTTDQRIRSGYEVVESVVLDDRRLHVVAERHVADGRAIELAGGVVLIGSERDPAIFVEVEDPLAVEVALVGLE